MDAYYRAKYNDENGKCDIFLYFIRVLAISSPVIADLVLSIISYDPECLTYFVLNYITIFFALLTFISGCCFFVDNDDDNCRAVCGMISFCILFIVIALEIAVLIFFIIDYKNLELLAIIGYFIQLIPFIFMIIYFIVDKCRY